MQFYVLLAKIDAQVKVPQEVQTQHAIQPQLQRQFPTSDLQVVYLLTEDSQTRYLENRKLSSTIVSIN